MVFPVAGGAIVSGKEFGHARAPRLTIRLLSIAVAGLVLTNIGLASLLIISYKSMRVPTVSAPPPLVQPKAPSGAPSSVTSSPGGAVWSGAHQDTSLAQRGFRLHGAHSFVSFSAYRLSASRVAVLGIGALQLRGRRRVQGCWWEADDGRRTEGRLSVATMEEHHDHLYELLQLYCDFSGQLPSAPGTLSVKLDNDIFSPYQEPHAVEVLPPDSRGPFRHQLAVCGAPMYGQVEPQSVVQWVAYHRHTAGVDRFVLYDAGALGPLLPPRLQLWASEGLVQIVGFEGAELHNAWSHNQALAMHDCMLAHRHTARWVAFLDLDEYIVVVPPTPSLPELLAAHEERAFVTHGAYWHSLRVCEQQHADVWSQERFAVELLPFRWEPAFCTDKSVRDPNLCPSHMGHRKLILNPRKVERVYIHGTETGEGGAELSAQLMYHAHYKRLTQPLGAACDLPQDSNEGKLLRRTHEVAKLARRARECLQKGSADKANCSVR